LIQFDFEIREPVPERNRKGVRKAQIAEDGGISGIFLTASFHLAITIAFFIGEEKLTVMFS
jgi:hypothetical protein